ncbi:hypothetical protein JHK87_000850 [Glycine soja]|nr:hypothetical protein JHK87_000850 [Glycine soja]
MIDGLGIAGWGVGEIEAKVTMLGQPTSMVLPGVVGFKLLGKLRDGVIATDLVLIVTQMLRKHGVVGYNSASIVRFTSSPFGFTFLFLHRNTLTFKYFLLPFCISLSRVQHTHLQSHTSSSLHFSNSDHAIGVGLIAFSVEMTNKAKGKGKEVAGKGFAGKRKGAFDDDKTDGGRKRNK